MNGEFIGIVGESPQIIEALETIKKIAPTDLSVLIIGESGTGKEVFAQAIHSLSRRAAKKMYAINCGAIPETLLESELFGHEKGAFTGATDLRKGLFEAADGGTVFLDEIGEMTLSTQVKLLRVLETMEYTRVGANEVRRTDVRVIAATNVNVEKAVAKGSFRSDLYYRLRSAQIYLPPLRDRRQDIPLLINHLARLASKKLGVAFKGISDNGVRAIQQYPWYGNIRELKNFLELIITLEKGNELTEQVIVKHLEALPKPNTNDYSEQNTALVHLSGVTPEQVERELIYRTLLELRNEITELKQVVLKTVSTLANLSQQVPSLPASPEANPELIFKNETQNLSLSEIEKKIILNSLEFHRGNRRAAAKSLGISERTLYRKLIDYSLETEDAESTIDDD